MTVNGFVQIHCNLFQDKRYHIVEELYRNEKEYVEALRTLKDVSILDLTSIIFGSYKYKTNAVHYIKGYTEECMLFSVYTCVLAHKSNIMTIKVKMCEVFYNTRAH